MTRFVQSLVTRVALTTRNQSTLDTNLMGTRLQRSLPLTTKRSLPSPHKSRTKTLSKRKSLTKTSHQANNPSHQKTTERNHHNLNLDPHLKTNPNILATLATVTVQCTTLNHHPRNTTTPHPQKHTITRQCSCINPHHACRYLVPGTV